MTIAEAAQQSALAIAADHQAPAAQAVIRTDPGLTYARVARAIRLTLMLQTRLLKERPALERAEAATRSAREQARREQAHRIAVRAIKCEHDDDAETVERLSDEAWERLRDEDLSEDVSGRPMGEVVGRICADLGLSLDWTAWAVAAATGDGAPPHDPPPQDPTLNPSRAAGALRTMATAPPWVRRSRAGSAVAPRGGAPPGRAPFPALSGA